MKLLLAWYIIIFLNFFAYGQQQPNFKESLSISMVRNPQISPDGTSIAFEKQTTDWENNKYITEIWLSVRGKMAKQITNNPKKGCFGAQWSPNGEWLSYLANVNGKNQIHLYNIKDKRVIKLTGANRSILSHLWSHDSGRIMTVERLNRNKSLSKLYGNFIEYGSRGILDGLFEIEFDQWLMSYRDRLKTSSKDFAIQRQLMNDREFSATVGIWSPDDTNILVGHQPDSEINSFMHSEISVYNVSDETLHQVVNNKSFDRPLAWAPDGNSFIYVTHLNDTLTNYYSKTNLFIKNLETGHEVQIAKDFDEYLDRWVWNDAGLFATGQQKTERLLFRIDPENGKCSKIELPVTQIQNYSFSANGEMIAFVGHTSESLPEVYTYDIESGNATKITRQSEQIQNWKTIQNEVVSWKSFDGQVIEGVLQKPSNFDASKKHPLLVIIHGGPIGISTPSQFKTYIYPTQQWLDKGALILRPNYRGSAGYGEAFRGLNVRNWGEGSSRDILAGISELESKGIIDENKIAVMGSSFGGYIAAYLNGSSNKFCAAAVGSGITDLATLYATTDIYPWVKQYMGGTPWEIPQDYKKASPLSLISKNMAPTLIQHGQRDGRIPITNAYQLYRGLKDFDVPTKLVVYPSFGHRIRNPKEQLFAMWNNWKWFGKYVWHETVTIPKN